MRAPLFADGPARGTHDRRRAGAVVDDGARGGYREKVKGENFPVALAVLPRHLREDLLAVYRYARWVDDLGDAADGDRTALLHAAEADVQALYDGGAPQAPEVAGLAPTLARAALPQHALTRLIRANLMDQEVSRYETFDELREYCTLSANPVGELVLAILGRATPDRVALSDLICTGLQLLEHLQDVAEDYRAGRIYLPQQDMARFAVSEVDLKAPAATEGLRALIGFETDRALAYVNTGAPLVSTLRGWGRLAVSGYVAGGRAAAAALRNSGLDPLPGPPKPGKLAIAGAYLTSTLRWPG